MRKLLLLLSMAMLASYATRNTSITKEERDFAIKYMHETQESFLKDIQGLSVTQLNFKAAPEKWSISQCIEHIAIAEKALMDIGQNNEKQTADPSKRSEIKVSDQDVLKVVTDRSRKSIAPEFMQPANKFKNSDEAVQAFIDQRKKNIDYIQTTNDDLRNHFLTHQVMGTIDGYQFILLIAAHSRRHTLQIEEVKADANFPKN